MFRNVAVSFPDIAQLQLIVDSVRQFLSYVAVPFAALVFLLIDTYPAVRNFGTTLRTGSFWVLWLIFGFLNTIAYGTLSIAAGKQIMASAGDLGGKLALIALATLGTVGVLQSLSLKVSGYAFVDVGKWIDLFRGRVLEDISRKVADEQRLKAIALANKLAQRFQEDPTDLRDKYARVMMFGGRTAADISKELEALESQTQEAHLSFVEVLATRIAQADFAAAQQLLEIDRSLQPEAAAPAKGPKGPGQR